MHRCRPYRAMNPLTGILAPRGDALGYRYASPDGDGWAVVAIATHSLAAPFCHTPYRFRPRRTATVWRHLQQHQRTPSSHTFSAKEKDSETGLSYFGARYYSSDLSIWFSVDPMSDKYPSTSPYAYCRNSPIILVDPNGMFDDEAKAIRFRNRAAKRYGEDRVSDVFNNTIDGGKADYAFSIYGKGKTKRSYSGGTNEFGGPIITCDKADKVVFSKKDYKSYAKSQRGRFEMGFSMSVGAQYGAGLHIGEQATGISIMGNIASIDLIGGSFNIGKDGFSTEGYCFDRSDIRANSGVSIDPFVSYNFHRNVSLETITYQSHSISSFGMEIFNSNNNILDSCSERTAFSFSVSAAVLIGVRVDIKYHR